MSKRKNGSYTKGNYYATVAKTRAMYGKRVTAEDYSELASKHSVAEIADYLKKIRITARFFLRSTLIQFTEAFLKAFCSVIILKCMAGS